MRLRARRRTPLRRITLARAAAHLFRAVWPSRRPGPGDLRNPLPDRPGAVTRTPGIADIRAAAERIGGFVRRTPLLSAAPVRENAGLAGELLLKLECLQVTGSFKARGAINAVFGLPAERLRHGIVTASGGNHGLAVAYAGWAAGVPRQRSFCRARSLPRKSASSTAGARVW